MRLKWRRDSGQSGASARDVTQLSDIERTAQMRTIVRLLAARSGQLLVISRLSADAGLPVRTLNRYLALLEEVFLVKRIPAWSRNVSALWQA